MKSSFSFMLFCFILTFIFSCGNKEEFSPIGVWEEVGKPENKMVVQDKNSVEIASRDKGSFRWNIYSRSKSNFYIGTENYNLVLLSTDSMEIFSKEMRQFKKVYRKKNSKIEGFWLLNLLMPRETVKEIVGEPDSISTQHQMEEWFYGTKKVIRFNKTGIYDFSENNIQNPDLASVRKGDHYKTVVEKVGDPYLSHDSGNFNGSKSHYSYYNGEITKFVFKDSVVTSIYLDLPRHQNEWMTLIDSEPLEFDFNLLETNNDGIKVEEKGKIVDHLIPEFTHDSIRGFLKLYGKKYHILIRIDDDNTFKAVYSRPIKRRRYKEDKLEIRNIKEMTFSLNAEMFDQNKMAAYLYFKINEPHSKNTVVSGKFVMDIPEMLE